MNNKPNIGIIAATVVLLVGALSYVYTAPYPGNEGLSRTPGVRFGGPDSAPPSDFSSLNDVGGNLIMKLSGVPPCVVYLSFVGTPEGVITATRPDGGYWARRVREGRNEGWLRIGDETYAMQAPEILGDARIPMLELWSGRTRMPMDIAVGGPDPLRDWEVFFWTPR